MFREGFQTFLVCLPSSRDLLDAVVPWPLYTRHGSFRGSRSVSQRKEPCFPPVFLPRDDPVRVAKLNWSPVRQGLRFWLY